jgi:adenosylcobinamide kinase/adenosylcobinamide-phosphate guanylyltransferase
VAVILVGGGSRSGKSRQALTLARQHGKNLAFVATAQALDDEMRLRIAQHRADRGREFYTVEEPLELPKLAPRMGVEFDAVVVDCLTLWLSNLLHAGRDVQTEADRFLAVASSAPAAFILVTNEVGCGIVPENELARKFRDLAGRLNQQAGEAAREVWWMVFGCPLKVK